MPIRPGLIALRRCLVMGSLAAGAATLTACQSQAPPVSASLLGLTAEANHRGSEIVDYRELVSIAGMLPMIEPGTFYHYPRRNWWQWLTRRDRLHSPSYAVGITPDFNQPTFYLVGDSDCDATDADIEAIKNQLETVQRLTAEVIRLSLEIAARKRKAPNENDTLTATIPKPPEVSDLLATLRQNQGDPTNHRDNQTENPQKPPPPEGPSTPKENNGNGDDGGPGGGQGPTPGTPPTTRLQQLVQQLDDIQAQLTLEEETYFRLLNNNPGVLVARWAVGQSEGGSASAGQIVTAQNDSTSRQAGFVILAKLRISVLYFGADFRSFIQATHDRDEAALERLGITSYLMQAQHVAYTSGREIEQYRSFSAEFSPDQFSSFADLVADIDKVRIQAYLARLENLENSATFDGLTWRTIRRPLLKYEELEPHEWTALKNDPRYGAMTPLGQGRGLEWRRIDHIGIFDAFRPHPENKVASGPQTVYAVMVSAKKLYQHWRSQDYNDLQPIYVGDRWYQMIDPEARGEAGWVKGGVLDLSAPTRP
ncbi:MAG: hypothetical protein AAGE65_15305 [Planctomycetota bacterium]